MIADSVAEYRTLVRCEQASLLRIARMPARNAILRVHPSPANKDFLRKLHAVVPGMLARVVWRAV